MTRLLITIWALYAGPAIAREFRALDLDSANVEIARFTCNREPMTPLIDCRDYIGRAEFNINFRLLEIGYWDNRVHTEGIEGRVKTVGWEYEAGIRIAPKMDVFYLHHSRHVMEGDQPQYYDPRRSELVQGKFPVEDSFGVRFKFYTNEYDRRSVFN